VHKLAQSVLAYVRKHDLLRPGDRVGIAVSAGADSVGLLRLMIELRDELGIVLSIVHLNHQLRAEDSDGDERFVRELAETHGLEIIAESRDVKAFSSERKLSLEAAAREVRYEFFRCMLLSKLNRIATAHTLDDQAETVLLKMMRGAGTRGLSGIYPKRGIGKAAVSRQPSAISQSGTDMQPSSDLKDPHDSKNSTIVRPLLGSRRSQLREYLVAVGQTWHEDASNQDLRHMRNRIRQVILPLLERQVNPAVCETLADSADIARAEEAYWDKEVDRVLPEIWSRDERGGTLKLSSRSFPLALCRRLLRAAAENLGIALEFRHVEEILGDGSGKGNSVLSGEWKVKQHRDIVTFSPADQMVSEYQYDLPVPGKVSVDEAGIVLETSVPEGADRRQKDDDFVDPLFARHKWVVRNWRPGERFWPAHTKGPKKIKELLQDRRIIGGKKQRWPVIACGDEIIWLSGFGVRQDLRAEDGVLIREIQGSDK
jgi:tRNA(Ile)-lysidine synthase